MSDTSESSNLGTKNTSRSWEQATLENLLQASLKEQQRKRRWGTFFKLLTFIYLGLLIWLLWPSDLSSTYVGKADKYKKHTALVDIRGDIADNQPANADSVVEGIETAFHDPNSQAIILRINSPGGSQVQAMYIYNDIMRLRHQYPQKKVYAVCTEVCASAAYLIASAANLIYASPASLVGSIGVLMDGFGFVDTLNKLGVQRRLLTAGEHKGFLDPFSPLSPDDARFVQQMLNELHQFFIRSVKEGRGSRLDLQRSKELFSGLAWTGNQALTLGLIDGFGSPGSIARDVIKNSNIVNYTVKPSLFDQLTNRMSASFAGEIVNRLGLAQGVIR